MRKINQLFFLLLISLFLNVSTTQAKEVPDWVKNFGKSRKYPESLYLVGFGSTVGKGTEASRIAQDNARADISRKIVVKVESLFSTVTEEKNKHFFQYTSSVTQSSTIIQLIGLQTEEYTDDSAKPTTYVLAYIHRSMLMSIYEEKSSKIRDEIKRIIAAAQEAELNSSKDEAVKKYLSLYPLYEELKEAETILLVARQSTSIGAAFDELAGIDVSPGSAKPSLMSQIEVGNKIDQLLRQSMNSVDDVARALVFQISKHVKQPEGKIFVIPFTYQNTKMSSPFARYFRAALETEFGQISKWNAVNQTRSFKPRSMQITRDLAEDSGAEWLLSGTYWEQDEKIKVLANLRNVNTGKLLAGAEAVFNKEMLESPPLDFKPQNFENALLEQKAFAEGEFVSGQLQVEVWTNKGSENLLFIEGETMKVNVRVNRESHIRLLYILADGRRTLLYDDYYIDQSKVNRVVEVPGVFVCAPPFGAELLICLASTVPFNEVKAVEEGGYIFITDESPKAVAREIRGFKKINNKESYQAEAKIVITTMEK
jgi:TolB-like protein